MAKSGTSAPTSAQRKLAAQRAAAARERIAVAQKRRRLLVAGSAIGVIVVLVAVLVVVRVALGSNGKSGVHRTQAQSGVAAQVADVPASEFDQIGAGSAGSPPEPNDKGPRLTGGGLPRVLFVGAEFCPYCAAERWAVAVALSRFGQLHGLGETRSSPTDYAPNTATLSFHGSSYTSKYIAFTGKELQSNQIVGNQYGPLDTLSSSDEKVFTKLGNAYPFIDLGGKFVATSPSYDPKLLQGKNQQQIAAAIHDPSSPIAQAVVGSANVLSARICQLTDNQPASVCSSAGVKTAASALAKSAS